MSVAYILLWRVPVKFMRPIPHLFNQSLTMKDANNKKGSKSNFNLISKLLFVYFPYINLNSFSFVSVHWLCAFPSVWATDLICVYTVQCTMTDIYRHTQIWFLNLQVRLILFRKSSLWWNWRHFCSHSWTATEEELPLIISLHIEN